LESTNRTSLLIEQTSCCYIGISVLNQS